MAWRLAKSLGLMFEQVNALAPDRDKSSDGRIGDEAHKARTSDHNAWISDPPGPDVVSAIDITHDPGHFDSYAFAEMLRETKDSRIKYVISARKIFNSADWTWKPYRVPPNKNPHTHHVHISVKADKPHYDDTRPWVIGSMPTVAPSTAVKRYPTLKLGSHGDDVRRLQSLLGIAIDGEFGPQTRLELQLFQRKAGLVDDGVAGRYTMEALEMKTLRNV